MHRICSPFHTSRDRLPKRPSGCWRSNNALSGAGRPGPPEWISFKVSLCLVDPSLGRTMTSKSHPKEEFLLVVWCLKSSWPCRRGARGRRERRETLGWARYLPSQNVRPLSPLFVLPKLEDLQFIECEL